MKCIKKFKNRKGSVTMNFNELTSMFEIEMDTPTFATFSTASNFEDGMTLFKDCVNELKE